MRKLEEIRARLDVTLEEGLPNRYIVAEIDAFADRIDREMQAGLVAEVMERYVNLYKELEEKGKQLKATDALRREAQVIAMLGNWELDLSTGGFKWSETMREVLELPDHIERGVDAHLGQVHPDDLPRVKEITKSLLQGIVTPENQYRIVTKDGNIKWVHMRCVIARNEDGGIGRIYGTLQDITSTKVVEETLWKYNNHLAELVDEKVAEASISQMATIHALVKLAESRDDDTGDHIARTAEYCRFIAQQLHKMGEYPDEIDDGFIEAIAQASPLHDIGKVGIPDAILLKPGRLTPEEFETMKKHVEIGHNTLVSVKKKGASGAFIKIGIEIISCHHEKWDGSGYPNGKKGVEIPISARIMAMADVYDALRSKRVYKPAYSHQESVDLITRGRGQHFDPLIVDIFLKHQQVFCQIFDRSQ